MMRHLLSLLVLSCLLLTACGGSEDGSGSESTKKSDGSGTESTEKTAGSGEAATGTSGQEGAATRETDPAPAKTESTTTQPTKPAEPAKPVVQEVDIPPLRFLNELPKEPVAKVNGETVSQAQLLEMLTEQNLATASNTLVQNKILELELAKEELTIDDAAVTTELEAMCKQIDPTKTVEEIIETMGGSDKHLRNQARARYGWKLIYWKAQKVPEDQREGEINPMLLTFVTRQRMEGYTTKLRGKAPAPPAGLVAQVIEKSTGNEINVTADEALDFLVGLMRPGALAMTRTQLIDRTLVESSLSQAGKSVPEGEVSRWVAEQHAKYQPPFTWEQILRIKGTSVDREIERYRRVLAWRRVTSANPTSDDLTAFRQENEDFFRGANKKVSHILVKVEGRAAGMDPTEEEIAAAEKKIELLYKKAREGVEFGWLAENYSDDTVTARGKGRLAAPIKKWGGALDPDFQRAAYSLATIGEICRPVRSQFGWHIIKLDESNPGKAPPSWDNPRYQEWILEEYETKAMGEWLESLRGSADIELRPEAELHALKNRSYFKSQGG